MYVNDVMRAVDNTHLQLYADDTVLVSQGTDANSAEQQLQPALAQFSKWCHQNKLSLNASKTKLMVFGTRQKVKKAKDVEIMIEGVAYRLFQLTNI